MKYRLLYFTALLGLLAACAPGPQAAVPAIEGVIFPTMTAGRVIRVSSGSGLANPATAIALANMPTPTPNTTACPAPDASASLADASPGGVPATSAAVTSAVQRYLTAGGSAGGMESVLRDAWAMLEGGFVRGDLDLTGDGTPEVLLSYRAPDAGGSLIIYGCADGRYVERYQAIMSEDASAAPPTLLNAADLNANGRPDLLFTATACDEDADVCQVTTQAAAWDAPRGRFVNLLGGGVTSTEAPTPFDIDGDRITEIVVRLTDDGSAQTGPLRTGQIVYDWDGASYVRSYTEYDPPRFRVQMIHDADEAYAQGRTRDAIALYRLAIDSPTLENWQNDDAGTLTAYARYRLLIAYADLEAPELVAAHAEILSLYPDLAIAPVYAELAIRFWEGLQAANNLRSACEAVRGVIAARPEAVGLLNRYGALSPVYDAQSVCPY
jgi:hypothetical protein